MVGGWQRCVDCIRGPLRGTFATMVWKKHSVSVPAGCCVRHLVGVMLFIFAYRVKEGAWFNTRWDCWYVSSHYRHKHLPLDSFDTATKYGKLLLPGCRLVESTGVVRSCLRDSSASLLVNGVGKSGFGHHLYGHNFIVCACIRVVCCRD